MADIIPLHGEDHEEVQALLPWYVTGQLEPADKAKVEAHLAACGECQAEVRFQRRLDQEIDALPMGVNQAWSRMKRRVAEEPGRRGAGIQGLGLARLGRTAPWAGWAAAAVLALALGSLAIPRASRLTQGVATYHALGSFSESPAGNVIVLFKPDASEATLRADLRAGHARMVDGPTAAGAYVLHVPASERDADLAALKAAPGVAAAEPIDGVQP